MGSEGYCITMDTVNPNLKVMQYAVLGPLSIRASEIEKELANGVKKPFSEVIKTTIGDCHAMGQVPMTYIRQVLALVAFPKELLEDSRFPEDVKEKARLILNGCPGKSIGSYSASFGIETIRRNVSEYISNRDGFPSNWENIILTSGASEAIKSVLNLLVCEVNGMKPGVLSPIPEYPLYASTLAEFGIVQIGYYLNEMNNWSLEITELERAVREAKKKCNPRALVIINPGNPTGQVLSRKNVEDVIKFAYKEKLMLLADEVYQGNIYAEELYFHSFKKVMMELGAPYSSRLELASFMSCSKGIMGECGLRGGYVELVNVCPQVKATLLKAISAMLCPNVIGQTAISCTVNPPKKGEPSYELFIKEKNAILQSLALRAKLVTDTFNTFEGITCNPVQGALYAFPQVKLPPKAIEAAKKKGIHADAFYAFELLERTGVCIVPGSGFGQRPGTYHFRTTILPQTGTLKDMLQKFSKFHTEFMKEYK